MIIYHFGYVKFDVPPETRSPFKKHRPNNGFPVFAAIHNGWRYVVKPKEKLPRRGVFLIRSVKLITFCKPCSVPLYCKRLVVSYSGGNHLSTDSYSSVLLLVHFLRESAPTIIWVSRSWGLPRSTLSISAKATSLWHFHRYSYHILKGLRHFPCRQPEINRCPSLFFRQARTLRASQPVRAWTFLYNEISVAAITRTLLMNMYYYYMY